MTPQVILLVYHSKLLERLKSIKPSIGDLIGLLDWLISIYGERALLNKEVLLLSVKMSWIFNLKATDMISMKCLTSCLNILKKPSRQLESYHVHIHLICGTMIKICKCVLLYTTILYSIMFILSADTLMSKGIQHFLTFSLVCVILVYLCYKLISKKEFNSFTGFDIIDSL